MRKIYSKMSVGMSGGSFQPTICSARKKDNGKRIFDELKKSRREYYQTDKNIAWIILGMIIGLPLSHLKFVYRKIIICNLCAKVPFLTDVTKLNWLTINVEIL